MIGNSVRAWFFTTAEDSQLTVGNDGRPRFACSETTHGKLLNIVVGHSEASKHIRHGNSSIGGLCQLNIYSPFLRISQTVEPIETSSWNLGSSFWILSIRGEPFDIEVILIEIVIVQHHSLFVVDGHHDIDNSEYPILYPFSSTSKKLTLVALNYGTLLMKRLKGFW